MLNAASFHFANSYSNTNDDHGRVHQRLPSIDSLVSVVFLFLLKNTRLEVVLFLPLLCIGHGAWPYRFVDYITIRGHNRGQYGGGR